MAKYLGIPLKLTGGTTVTPTYGNVDLITDGDFPTGSTAWTKEGTWTISGNVANRTAQNSDFEILQAFTSNNTKTWLVSFELKTRTAGGVGVRLNGGTVATYYTTPAVYTEVLTGGGTATHLIIQANGTFAGTVDNVSVTEVSLGNYLQVVGGDFLTTCKVGDLVFNTTDKTEAVIVQVLDNNTLLLSNDSLSTAGDVFSIFASNGDTRGNQILKIDNYIISEYDEATSAANASSFWFAAGPQADKVTLTQLNNAVNTYFVADVIERFVQRLNAQSATASRLDIPLDEFRDHKYNQVLTTTAITLS
jgi:hypothetical protein